MALQSVARGFAGAEAKPVNVVRSISGKLKLARNLRKLREVMEPAEGELMKERDRLMEEQKAATPDAKDLDLGRTAEMNTFVRELNAQEIELTLESFVQDDLDLDKFEGEDAIQALSVMDGVVLT